MRMQTVFVVAVLLISSGQALSYSPLKPVPALFVFGDSLSDAGTNNYVVNSTTTANMHPYGETFFKGPTGRFCDGRIIVDFLAEALGIPFPRPYLQPAALFFHGANFASGGSGFLDSTDSSHGVVSLRTQLEQFRNLTEHMKHHFSGKILQEFFMESVIFFGEGSNDIANNYLTNLTLQNSETREQFVSSLVDHYSTTIKELHSIGFRKIITLGLGPIGCTPKAKYEARRFGLADPKTGCLEQANNIAVSLNQQLGTALQNFTMELQDAQLILLKPYNLMSLALKTPFAGFVNATDACCGAGMYGAARRCGLFYGDPKLKPYLCKSPSEYLFWDYVHPTEAANSMLMRFFWYGDNDVVEPLNLGELFEGYNVRFTLTRPPKLPSNLFYFL